MRPPLVVWQFTDGKPGHESQTRGLIAALRRRADVHAYPIDVAQCRCGIASLLRRRHPCKFDYPPPDLILACGRTTHFAALAARRACGGKLVALMKPPLPTRLYDLCFVPVHDGVAAGPNVMPTRGVLNPITAGPMTDSRRGQGLFLIGGPSTHHGWAAVPLVDQIERVVKIESGRHWTLTTSRRTPAEFVPLVSERLKLAQTAGRLDVVPVEQTPQGWVARQLAASDAAVVTEDSVSMVYESLTAGVSVNLLPMPRLRQSRVLAGVESLLTEGLARSIDDYLSTGHFADNAAPLAEADRCAQAVLTRWFARAARAA